MYKLVQVTKEEYIELGSAGVWVNWDWMCPDDWDWSAESNLLAERSMYVPDPDCLRERDGEEFKFYTRVEVNDNH
jgi:hypothetical protein